MDNMPGLRYRLNCPDGDWELPGTMMPQTLMFEPPQRLVRAFGYRQVYDLSDGLSAAEPLVLKGLLVTESEEELSLTLREWQRRAQVATGFDRGGRASTPLLSAVVFAAPSGNASNLATMTVRLTLLNVMDNADLTGDWSW